MKWIRRLLVAGGLALAAVGLTGVLRSASVGTVPYLRFMLFALLFGDVLVMPVVLLAGAIAARALPGPVRVPVQAALSVSAAVALVSLPLLLGYGRDPALPSALPRDYPRGLLIVLAVVWAGAAVAVLVRLRVRRAAGPRTGSRR
ncbi:hypothetical protein [Hamadaea tsunoensis]|uniref:hypothetical protein n=1 Tax=Hamadaea tsunoensis TaxID=53368 RepID=UPI00041CBAF9|nr:hypothetical protein [Hamadaea tsunoensis]